MNRDLMFGMDEAGFGPLLGPLVLVAVGLSGPSGVTPYSALRKVVCRKNDDGRLWVSDSKKVFAGRRGFSGLEKVALTFLTLARGRPFTSVGDLLATTGLPADALGPCPWYCDLTTPLPRTATSAEVELAVHLVGRELERSGIALQLLSTRPVEVVEWNSLLQATGNKSLAHFRIVQELLRACAAATATGRRAHVVVDRCGGRMRYGGVLGETFAGAGVETERESDTTSTYRVQPRDGGALRITFLEKAEDHAFAVALASCVAKYVREIMVEQINRWFSARVPSLKPTAGYVMDGLRFLEDVRTVIDAPGFPRQALVRDR